MTISNTRRISMNLGPTEQESKPKLSEQSLTILNHRYFMKNETGDTIEDAEGMFRRVARALAEVDLQYGALPVEVELTETDFYQMLKNTYCLPNSPTLMNAGINGTMSACFVLPLEDSMEDIMSSATDTAMVQKFGGGTGFALSKIRPQGSKIKSTHGIACGPISVLKTLSRVSSMITQGGRRDGANMAVMDIRHPDIMEFIHCKTQEGDIHNFNISVGVDSDFMQAVENNMNYNLINPSDSTVAGSLNAKEVFDEIVQGAWKNGEPGMIFLDRVNKDNVVLNKYGPMIATNPCGEQPLLANESCNLASIVLSRFFIPSIRPTDWRRQINWDKLESITKTATHFLDNVIDGNEYATPAIQQMTQATRKIGLGVMGFADLLIQLKIPYNSDKAREIGGELMKSIRVWADEKSMELAVQRGPYPAWEEESGYPAYRNACRMTVAPTGTISMIADTASGIEPTFSLAWVKQNILEGKSLYYTNQLLAKEKFFTPELAEHLSNGGTLSDAEGFDIPQWAKEVYITAPEISPRDHVLMQATFQQYVDAGISKTINFPNEAEIIDVEDAYMLAWKSGCKGITVYRAGSRDKEVLVKGTTEQQEHECPDGGIPNIVFESGCETCKTCGWSLCHIA